MKKLLFSTCLLLFFSFVSKAQSLATAFQMPGENIEQLVSCGKHLYVITGIGGYRTMLYHHEEKKPGFKKLLEWINNGPTTSTRPWRKNIYITQIEGSDEALLAADDGDNESLNLYRLNGASIKLITDTLPPNSTPYTSMDMDVQADSSIAYIHCFGKLLILRLADNTITEIPGIIKYGRKCNNRYFYSQQRIPRMTDGTAEVTKIKNRDGTYVFDPRNFYEVGNKVLFGASYSNRLGRVGLYATDGTSEGTGLLDLFRDSLSGGDIQTVKNGRVFMNANSDSGSISAILHPDFNSYTQLKDSTGAALRMVRPLHLANQIVFQSGNYDIYTLDDSTDKPSLRYSSTSRLHIRDYTASKNRAYYLSSYSSNGTNGTYELIFIDETTGNSGIVAQISVAKLIFGGSYRNRLAALDNEVFMVAPDYQSVLKLSEASPINFSCYHDLNGNGQRDSAEYGLDQIEMKLSGSNGIATLSTNAQGQIKTLIANDKYGISILNKGWKLSSNNSGFELPKDQGKTIELGLVPDGKLIELNARATITLTRCGFKVPMWVDIRNSGNQKVDAELTLNLDTSVKVISENIKPSAKSNRTLTWDFGELLPTESKQVKLMMQMPGVDRRGDTLVYTLDYKALINRQVKLQTSDTLESEITCAYDPNDKQVSPAPIGDENLTLINQKLRYRIRFQNTGNDTAFNVRIDDTLSQYLDLKTFKVLSSSHDMQTVLSEETRQVSFSFPDILLPDSNIDEPNSHGYIEYEIEHNPGLSERTSIKNTAHIYFDYNPAIVTNTTENVMVTTIVGLEEAPSDKSLHAYPNPGTGMIALSWPQELKNATLLLRNAAGQLITQVYVGGENSTSLDLSGLPKGLYMLQLRSSQGVFSQKLLKR